MIWTMAINEKTEFLEFFKSLTSSSSCERSSLLPPGLEFGARPITGNPGYLLLFSFLQFIFLCKP